MKMKTVTMMMMMKKNRQSSQLSTRNQRQLLRLQQRKNPVPMNQTVTMSQPKKSQFKRSQQNKQQNKQQSNKISKKRVMPIIHLDTLKNAKTTTTMTVLHSTNLAKMVTANELQ